MKTQKSKRESMPTRRPVYEANSNWGHVFSRDRPVAESRYSALASMKVSVATFGADSKYTEHQVKEEVSKLFPKDDLLLDRAPAQTIPRPPPPRSFSSDDRGSNWRVEARGSAGVNSGPNREVLPNVTPSYGAQVAIRGTSYLAVTGHYLYNDFGSANFLLCQSGVCTTIKGHAKIQEVMGGVRISAGNNGHVSPFAAISVGLANASASAGTSVFGIGISARDSINKFAFAPGGGVNFRITRRFGASFDVHYVKIVDATWYVRALGGVFVRF